MNITTILDCRLMAENGNCEFYTKCLEQRLQCGSEGYAVAYGYKFCNKFSKYYDDLTEDVGCCNYLYYQLPGSSLDVFFGAGQEMGG